MNPEALAQKAMEAMNSGQLEEALSFLKQAVEDTNSERPDLLNAMGVVALQLGNVDEARELMKRSVELAWEQGADPDFIAHATLGLAAACEDQDDPAAALDAYDQLLEGDPTHARGRVGRGNLLLAMGRLDDGLEELEGYLADARDQQDFLDAAQALVDAVRGWRAADRNPRDFLVAHRESYVDFFDETVSNMAEKGWIAECARMKRDDEGKVVLSIDPAARPYAGIRVDLVDPESGQAGQVGEQPMVVGVSGFEPLARAVVAFPVPGTPFPLWVSSQCPWDQLPIQILMRDGDATELLDEKIGAWYTDGFNGRYGTKESGRLHYISDPEPRRGGRGVVYYVDFGRTSLLAIEGLLEMVSRVHDRHPVAQVLIGRGHIRGTRHGA